MSNLSKNTENPEHIIPWYELSRFENRKNTLGMPLRFQKKKKKISKPYSTIIANPPAARPLPCKCPSSLPSRPLPPRRRRDRSGGGGTKKGGCFGPHPLRSSAASSSTWSQSSESRRRNVVRRKKVIALFFSACPNQGLVRGHFATLLGSLIPAPFPLFYPLLKV